MNPHRCLLNLILVAEHAWSWKHFVTWVVYRQAVGLNCLCILWGCVPVYVGCPRPSTNAAIVLLSNDRWMNIEHWWNESDRKNGSTRRKTCLIAALFTKNPTHMALIREKRFFTLTITDQHSEDIFHFCHVCHTGLPSRLSWFTCPVDVSFLLCITFFNPRLWQFIT